METYYKAVRPDGTDFHSGTVQWIPKDGKIPEEGWVVKHPTQTSWEYRGIPMPSVYLSVSVEPGSCTGMSWPCRLLRVEPVGKVYIPNKIVLPYKRAALSWKVVEELPPHTVFGPNGEECMLFLHDIEQLNPNDLTLITKNHTLWEQDPEYLREELGLIYPFRQHPQRYTALLVASGIIKYQEILQSARGFDLSIFETLQITFSAIVLKDILPAPQYQSIVKPWYQTMDQLAQRRSQGG